MPEIRDGLPIVFMEKWFPELPPELQNLIMSKTYRIPRSKFRNGSSVMYTEEYHARTREQLREGRWPAVVPRSLLPSGRLIVCHEPRFNWKRYEWEYDYEYGPFGEHEGTALESTLALRPRVGGLTYATC